MGEGTGKGTGAGVHGFSVFKSRQHRALATTLGGGASVALCPEQLGSAAMASVKTLVFRELSSAER
jgi:hypothetical protein